MAHAQYLSLDILLLGPKARIRPASRLPRLLSTPPDCADKSSTGRRLRVPHHLLPSLLHRQTHAVYCSRSRAPTSRRRCVVMSGWVEAVNRCWAGRSRMLASYREDSLAQNRRLTPCLQFRFSVFRFRLDFDLIIRDGSALDEQRGAFPPRHASVSTLLTPVTWQRYKH